MRSWEVAEHAQRLPGAVEMRHSSLWYFSRQPFSAPPVSPPTRRRCAYRKGRGRLPAASNGQGGARNITCFIRRQVQDRIGDLARLSDPPHRHELMWTELTRRAQFLEHLCSAFSLYRS